MSPTTPGTQQRFALPMPTIGHGGDGTSRVTMSAYRCSERLGLRCSLWVRALTAKAQSRLQRGQVGQPHCQVTTPYYLCSLAAKEETVQWTVQLPQSVSASLWRGGPRGVPHLYSPLSSHHAASDIICGKFADVVSSLADACTSQLSSHMFR